MTAREHTTVAQRMLVALLALVALLFGVFTSAAGAQDAEDPPPDETAEDGEDSGPDLKIELPNVTVDEDGTVRWVIENDPETADEPENPVIGEDDESIPGTIIPNPGTLPTVGVETGSDAPASDPEPIVETEPALPPADGGKLSPVILIASGVVVLATIGGLLYFRRKRQEDEIEGVEQSIIPNDVGDFELDPEFQYEGASAAGAYEAGGAAYAQHVEGTTPPEEATPGRILSLHTSMVDLADKGLSDVGRDKLVARKLEAAGSQVRPGEWLLMAIGGTTAALLLSTFFLGWLLALPIAALVAFGFWTALDYQATRRANAFADDLPETLQLIAGSLRGGTSIMQAVQTVADESDEPTASEFQRIVAESRLGRDIGVSFREVATRMDSQDFDWVVTAIDIHREVGGDLAGILDRVGSTIRARNRVRGQVASLSAEGKLSGLILFLLPPLMVGMIALLNREYLDEMAGTGEGQLMMVFAAVLLLIGGAWLKRLARFVY